MSNTELFKRILVFIRKTRWCFLCTKWIPIIFTIGLTIHCWLLYFGYRLEIVEYLFVCPPIGWLLFMYLSHKMHFCAVHRAMIAYVGIVSVCHILNRYEFFGSDVQLWRFSMGTIGVGLIISLYIKVYVRKEKIASSSKGTRCSCGC